VNRLLTSRLYVGSLLAAASALVVALMPPGIIARSGYWIAVLVAMSGYLAHRAHRLLQSQITEQQRRAEEMSGLHLATIEAIALAIAAKQQAGHDGLRRVHLYAAGLARSLGMTDSEIQGVKAAALLHDIGELAVPEYLLWKPGPLAPEELRKTRIHPQAGVDIIHGVPFPYPVAPLILSHHERWDGSGYPAGLAGNDIPLGARILSTTDYFEALTSESSMTAATALERLQQERGKALDPTVVDAFVRAYPALAAEAEAMVPPPEPVRSTPPESWPDSSALHDISLAHREARALYEIAQAMSRSLGVSDTMELLSNKLSAVVPLSSCALFVRVDEAGTIGCRFATGVDADRIQRLTMRDGQWSAQWAGGNRLPFGHVRTDANLEVAVETDARTVLSSALVHPLVFNDRFVGMLAVYHTEPLIYTDDHARLLGRICEQAAALIHHSIVFEQTQEDSLRDPLTGLANARYLFMHVRRELARAERLRSTVSLLLLDLDGFKNINDSHGHHAGDRALRTVAASLQSAIRSYDVLVRYAGDEFVVVLSGCAREEAERKRLDLQKAIDDVPFQITPGHTLPLAISVGLAVFPEDGVSCEELLAAADRRMYGDKTSRKRHGVVPL
jgi:diguanylate cyclase (GGDEF)-like protein